MSKVLMSSKREFQVMRTAPQEFQIRYRRFGFWGWVIGWRGYLNPQGRFTFDSVDAAKEVVHRAIEGDGFIKHAVEIGS